MDLLSVLGLGALGACGFLLLAMYKNGFSYIKDDLKKLLHIALGVFAAYAAALMGIPKHFNSLLMGWLAPTILEEIMKGTERIKNSKKGCYGHHD